MKRRIMSALLVMVLCVGLLPMAAYAVRDVFPYEFCEGLALIEKDGKYGFIDTSGEVVIPFEYDDAQSFSEGLAFVQKNYKSGYIDKTCKVVIPLTYDYGNGSFSEGLAAVRKDTSPGITLGHGYIDKSNNLIIPHKWYYANDFSHGLAAVAIGDCTNNTWGFIDKKGNIAIPIKYEFASDFSDGLAAVKQNGKYGYIDVTGNVVIPFEYDAGWSFSGGLAAVRSGDKFGYIDKSGTLVIPCEYEWFWDCYEDLAPVEKDCKCGFVDTANNVVIPFEYSSVFSFSEGLARVSKYGKYGFIDKLGNVIIPLEYDYATWQFSEGYAIGVKNGELVVLKNPLISNHITEKPDSWAVTEVSGAMAVGLVPDSIANAGWQTPTSRLAAAEAIVLLIEKAAGKTMTQLAAESGWNLNANCFSDTNDQAVSFLKHAGVTTGVGDNRYDPNGTYTRAQIVTMIGRAAEVFFGVTAHGANPFTDVPDWAAPYVGYAADNGITHGVGDSRFDSYGILQNQHTSVFIYRAFNALKTSPAPTPTPTPTPTPAPTPTPTPTPTPAPTPTPTPTPTPNALEFEKTVFDLVNIERVNHGLRPFEWHDGLANVARKHSIDMAERDYFDHICPDGRDVWDRITSEGMSPFWTKTEINEDGSWSQWTFGARENIAFGYKTPGEVVSAWMSSPGHRSAILSENHTHMGVGFYNYYWTQVFSGLSN